MKNKGLIITLIVILGFFALALTGGFIYYLVKGNNFNFSFNFKNANMKLVDSYETEITNVNKIYFDLLSTDVEIKASKDEKILVEYHSNQEKNGKIEFKDNTITVDESISNLTCFGICNARRKIILYLPNNNVEIEIKTKSGDIKSGINLNNLNITTVSGDVSLKEIESLDFSTTSGDIVIDKITKKFTIKTVSGDILIHTLSIDENSNINTVSGDLVVTDNAANCYIDFTTVSGDNIIKKSDRKSDVVLNIHTISGDVSVN